jgi:hypothetical protein
LEKLNKFYLKVYDNFHYGDESESYQYGQYKTYEEARKAAENIVFEFLESNWKPGFTSNTLLSQYSFYGEDHDILPSEPGEKERFSAQIQGVYFDTLWNSNKQSGINI